MTASKLYSVRHLAKQNTSDNAVVNIDDGWNIQQGNSSKTPYLLSQLLKQNAQNRSENGNTIESVQSTTSHTTVGSTSGQSEGTHLIYNTGVASFVQLCFIFCKFSLSYIVFNCKIERVLLVFKCSDACEVWS